MGKKVYRFETSEQAWSFINVASTAGYTSYDSVRPMLQESVGGVTVELLPEYSAYQADLSRLSRSVRAADVTGLDSHQFSFDKFMTEAVTAPIQPQQEEDSPMRLRARHHQELPQNRIRVGGHE